MHKDDYLTKIIHYEAQEDSLVISSCNSYMINPVLLLWKIVYAKVASSHGLVVITAPVAQLIVKQTIM